MNKERHKISSLAAGLILSLLLYVWNPFDVPEKAGRVLAVAALMISWWVTEALPMPVVALLPLVLFPLLGINDIKNTASSYGNEVIFLFMGGFMLGLAIEKWNVHKRIALNIVRLTGTSGNRIILGFILASGLLSMWLSNTATTMLMFPIALSVAHVMRENHEGGGHYGNFNLSLMLSIAYASNFGGIATIIGTPPNVQFVAFFEKKYQTPIEFVNWFLVCAPVALLLMLSFYFVCIKILFPNHIRTSTAASTLIRNELRLLGPPDAAQKRVFIIFTGTALLWIFRKMINDSQPWIKLDDTMIAVIGAVALFMCPSSSSGFLEEQRENTARLLTWEDTRKMAWGILLLFGGGIALADALEKAGLIQRLGSWLSQFAGAEWALVITVVALSIFISEVMSNVAQVIVFSPVVCSLADSIGMNPLLLGLPMTLAASCASMLPMGTPPNAIVFASGHIRLKDMLKAGFIMNVLAIVLISLFCLYVLPWVME
ncbi:MAG: DASS family sodium-coupled anion symporter [Chitinophagaceae bacterium]|nr:DASS family sodium-coupled anion symporter [Chitinophagaceae bacterium]